MRRRREGAAVAPADRIEDVDAGCHHFGADAVTREEDDVQRRVATFYWRVGTGAGTSWPVRTASMMATISASDTCFWRSASAVIWR